MAGYAVVVIFIPIGTFVRLSVCVYVRVCVCGNPRRNDANISLKLLHQQHTKQQKTKTKTRAKIICTSTTATTVTDNNNYNNIVFEIIKIPKELNFPSTDIQTDGQTDLEADTRTHAYTHTHTRARARNPTHSFRPN